MLKERQLTSFLAENFTERQFLKLWFNGIIHNLDVIENHNLVIVAFKSSTCRQEVELIFNKLFVWEKLDLSLSIPETKVIHLRTLARNGGQCVFSKTQLLDVDRALKNNVTDREKSKVWLGMFIIKLGRLSKDNLSMINLGTNEVDLITECGLYSLAKAGESKLGILVNCKVPVNRSFLNNLFFNYMDFSARTNTNIVWQKHYNRYEKELLYFIENGENLIFDILDELSSLEKYKPVFASFNHENPTNFNILDNITDVHKGSTKLSSKSKQLSKGALNESPPNQTTMAPSKRTRFLWVGLMPKNMLVKDLVQENFMLKHVKIGRLDKVKNIVIVDPTAIEFESEVKPFLNAKIIWIQISEGEICSRISEVKLVRKQSLNSSQVSFSTFSKTWIGNFKSTMDFSSGIDSEKVITFFDINKSPRTLFIEELEVYDIEDIKEHKVIKIVMNQWCYFLGLIGQVQSPKINWNSGSGKLAESYSKLKPVFKKSNITDFLLTKEFHNPRISPTSSNKRPKERSSKLIGDVHSKIEGVSIKTLDILKDDLQEEILSKHWILVFDNEIQLSNFFHFKSFDCDNLLHTRLCQIETAAVFEGIALNKIVNSLGNAKVRNDLSALDSNILKVVHFSFINSIKLRDLHKMINLTLNWLPINIKNIQGSKSVVKTRDLLAEWGLFSNLESYIMFRLEGKTANFFVKDHGINGYVMAVPRDSFDVARFDEELLSMGGAVVNDLVQINKYRSKSYTVRFSHIPLDTLNTMRSRLFGKTISEFVVEVLTNRIRTKDELKLWNNQRHVKISAMS